MKFFTKCVKGETKQNPHGSLTVPIYQTSTYEHYEGNPYTYARTGNPTRTELEKHVASLENGKEAIALSSGMAATVALSVLFEKGDHIIATEDLYGGSSRYFQTIAQDKGVTTTFVDTASLDNIAAALTAKTRAVFIETPTNPTLIVSDLKRIASFAKQHNLLVIVDNTFLTPYFQRPLDLGADIIIHSGTKYLGGHHDTLAGFLVFKDQETAEKVRFFVRTLGCVLAPFDCFLLIRGLKTLHVRMQRHEENALIVANWLTQQPQVTKVLFNGLPSNPYHDLAKEQASGFGAVISFYVATAEHAQSILNSLNMICFAESLGGVDTLLTYPITQTHTEVPKEKQDRLGINTQLLRLSVGIEDVQDIIDDLKQAIEAEIDPERLNEKIDFDAALKLREENQYV